MCGASGRCDPFLEVRLKKTPVGDDVDLRMLAMATAGYTGADLAAVCREAALAALEEDLGAAGSAVVHLHVQLFLFLCDLLEHIVPGTQNGGGSLHTRPHTSTPLTYSLPGLRVSHSLST